MSKIANRIITIPKEVKITLEGGSFFAEGPLGKSKSLQIPKEIEVELQDGKILTKSSLNIPLAGTFNSLISNFIYGVVHGYQSIMEVKGIGYKVSMKEKGILEFSLGKSHLNYVTIPEDLDVKLEGNKIIIKGVDKQSVGIFAANKVRTLRKPSVYKKSKGIYYQEEDERMKIKPGKSLNK
jgi:large subunit ribosomal protein L6